MGSKPTKVRSAKQDTVRRAYGVMSDIRAALYQRLADYVLQNEERVRAETLGEESYSFCLQQMDELYLNKLSIIERAVQELARGGERDGQPTTTTYETVEVVARREDLPQKVADALAEHGDSDLLDVCMLRADEKQAELLLVLAREDSEALSPDAHGLSRDDGPPPDA